MPHPEYWQHIEAHADRCLPAPDAAELEEHLQTCNDCATRLSRAAQEIAWLLSAFAPPEPPHDLVQEVVTQIENRERK